MEKQGFKRDNTCSLGQRNIHYSLRGGFETGRPYLDWLMNRWWDVFHKLATIPSTKEVGVGKVKSVVNDIYSAPRFEKTGVTIDDISDGPMVITIPEYNPQNTEFQPLIFAGHLDVVKGDPSSPEIEGSHIKSRGPAVDNKGPVAAIIATTTFIMENNIPHPRLRIILTGDEETDGQHIRQVPIGSEEIAFIADKSGSLGTIVMGSGGYTGIQATIQGLTGEKALEFLGNFDQRMGRNMISRRQNTTQSFHSLRDVLGSRDLTVDTIIVGPNNSRNTVADTGYIRGTVFCTNEDNEYQMKSNLNSLLAPMGATVEFSQGDDKSFRLFEISLHGKAGHTSKAKTEEDDGFITVFSDAASLVRPERLENSSHEVFPSDEVRINIGSMSGVRKGREMDISLSGEARYKNSNDALLVLKDLQHLVESYGGSMEIVEENGAYQLDPQANSVRMLQAVLEKNGYTPSLRDGGYGISDANNAPRQWNTVVFSDGSMHPHTSDEAITIDNVAGLLQVFYDLATEVHS